MNKHYYIKKGKLNIRKFFKFFSLSIAILGFIFLIYVFFPLLSWQIYFAPVFAEQNIAVPIPKTEIVTPLSIKSLASLAVNNFSGIDYSNADNWFPTYKPVQKGTPRVSSYKMSIPKLNIKDATVSTVDHDLDKHLVNYIGTAIPPDNGNAVVYGHSTLPQLFNPKDYKKIFATLHTLKVGDEFKIDVQNVTYSYKIFNITVVEPTDTSIFMQNYDNSYITLVTCTPPGTTWKRLIIKAKLQKI
ncbi:MAG: sortase [Patescibacteria group bacterium]|nr:sortase [Patescibacteria group bacterium]